MPFLEFIKYIKKSPKDKNTELTSAQHAFLNWIERCKKKGLDPFRLKGNGRVQNYLTLINENKL